jgi:hypothetical protein
LDVPLHWVISKYEYYQIKHQQRLLLGHVPRITTPFLTGYAESVPFVPLFKDPDRIKDDAQLPLDKRDVLWFIEFFDLSWIVFHKDYMWPETFERLMRFVMTNFPVAHVEAEGDIVAVQLARDTYNVAELAEPGGYLVDFGSTTPQFFIADGWSYAERWDKLTVAWSSGKESQLWVFLPRIEDFVMELRLKPFIFPANPPQGIQLYVNGRFSSHIPMPSSEWESYTVSLPHTQLTQGINTFRFVYDYAVIPAEVVPGGDDPRTLAVAYDYIRFRPE